MPRPNSKDGLDKFSRYRANQRHRGMRLVRLWVPDPKAVGFRREARRQAMLLGGAADEQESLDFIEAVSDFSE